MTQRSSILYWEEEEEERRGQVGEGVEELLFTVQTRGFAASMGMSHVEN